MCCEHYVSLSRSHHHQLGLRKDAYHRLIRLDERSVCNLEAIQSPCFGLQLERVRVNFLSPRCQEREALPRDLLSVRWEWDSVTKSTCFSTKCCIIIRSLFRSVQAICFHRQVPPNSLIRKRQEHQMKENLVRGDECYGVWNKERSEERTRSDCWKNWEQRCRLE